MLKQLVFFFKKSLLASVCLFVSITVLLSVVLYGYNAEYYISASATAKTNVVIIDPGHGGEDSGTVGTNGVYEKDLNLSVAGILGSYLKKAGFIVVYTRTEDSLLYTEEQNIKGMRKIYDLKNRLKISEEYPDALFISIHMNSFGESKYSGLQVYYSLKSEESYTLASDVQNEVKARIQPDNNRKTKAGKNIYLLENIENTAILIECGFLSNPEECKKLSEKEYQKELSFAILCGIIKYSDSKIP